MENKFFWTFRVNCCTQGVMFLTLFVLCFLGLCKTSVKFDRDMIQIQTCTLILAFRKSKKIHRYFSIFADVSIYLTLSTRKSVASCTNINGHNFLSKQEFFMKLTLKLVSIFYQIFIFNQMIALQKLWKMFFVSSKKLFSFLRYSNFCISVFPSFSPCQPLRWKLFGDKS